MNDTDVQTLPEDQNQIGVALSGGGHRATAFTLGTLLYLADASKNSEVVSIASVSGGSLTNGFVAHSCDYSEENRAGFRKVAAELADIVARRGTLWSAPLTWVYLAATVVTLGLLILAVCQIPSGFVASLVCIGLLLLWGGLFVSQRGRICARAFRNSLFADAKSPPRMSNLASHKVQHVFCATEMQTAQHLYFTGKFTYSYNFGLGTSNGIALHDAIQASASFPGGFPIRWFPSKLFEFKNKLSDRPTPKWVALLDGGVYDNMGEQWLANAGKRLRELRSISAEIEFRVPNFLVVVNASSNFRFKSSILLRIPLLNEIMALLQVSDVMYDNTTTQRRTSLFKLFTDTSGNGTPGVFVMIDRSALDSAISVHKGKHFTDEQKRRANSVLEKVCVHLPMHDNDKLSDEALFWEKLAQANRNVRTTLCALGVAKTAKLMLHGYASAMFNLHIFHNFPLLDIATQECFEQLIMQGTNKSDEAG